MTREEFVIILEFLHKKLLPCPFCGETSAIRLNYSENNDEQCRYVCVARGGINGVGCGSSTGFAWTKEKAAELWNTRTNLTISKSHAGKVGLCEKCQQAYVMIDGLDNICSCKDKGKIYPLVCNYDIKYANPSKYGEKFPERKQITPEDVEKLGVGIKKIADCFMKGYNSALNKNDNK